MFLVGYSLQFFSWLWGIVLPAGVVTDGVFTSMTVRICVLFPSLICFIFAAALYMDVDLGTAPYDAVPYIIWNALKKESFFYSISLCAHGLRHLCRNNCIDFLAASLEWSQYSWLLYLDQSLNLSETFFKKVIEIDE